jgi:hypothetical protein
VQSSVAQAQAATSSGGGASKRQLQLLGRGAYGAVYLGELLLGGFVGARTALPLAGFIYGERQLGSGQQKDRTYM